MPTMQLLPVRTSEPEKRRHEPSGCGSLAKSGPLAALEARFARDLRIIVRRPSTWLTELLGGGMNSFKSTGAMRA